MPVDCRKSGDVTAPFGVFRFSCFSAFRAEIESVGLERSGYEGTATLTALSRSDAGRAAVYSVSFFANARSIRRSGTSHSKAAKAYKPFAIQGLTYASGIADKQITGESLPFQSRATAEARSESGP